MVRSPFPIPFQTWTTVHKDVTERLKDIDGQLYENVKAVLAFNLSERHIRGGMATKQKYAKVRRRN